MSQGRDAHPNVPGEGRPPTQPVRKIQGLPQEGLGHELLPYSGWSAGRLSWQGGHCTQKRVGLGEAKLRPEGNAGRWSAPSTD